MCSKVYALKTKASLLVMLAICAGLGMLVPMVNRAAFWQEHRQVRFDAGQWRSAPLTGRRQMISDLVNHILPDKTREEILDILGPSPTPEEAMIAGPVLFPDDAMYETGRLQRRGSGLRDMADYYYQHLDHEWDLAYPIGRPRHRYLQVIPEASPSTDLEVLLVRFNKDGRFSNWYITGETPWGKVVQGDGVRNFCPFRK